MVESENPAPKITAIVLAAGRSERMGAFKPLLPFGNSTVIEACIANLRSGGVETIVVVVSPDQRGAKLQHHLANSAVTLAINPAPLSEMSDSICVGIRQLPDQAEAVLITPADHPAVPSNVVAALIAQWLQGAKLVVPTWKNRGGHPVLVDLGFRSELVNLDQHRGLRKFFEIHSKSVCRIAVKSKYIARDMDTWDDYRVLHEEVFGVLPPASPDFVDMGNK